MRARQPLLALHVPKLLDFSLRRKDHLLTKIGMVYNGGLSKTKESNGRNRTYLPYLEMRVTPKCHISGENGAG